MRIWIVVLCALTLLVLFAASCAPLEAPQARAGAISPTLTGTFAANVPKDMSPLIPDQFDQVAGTWHMSLFADGTYRLYQDHVLRTEGTYSVMGDQIVFQDAVVAGSSADGAGTYRWTLRGGSLRLQAVADSNEPRRFALTCDSWQRM